MVNNDASVNSSYSSTKPPFSKMGKNEVPFGAPYVLPSAKQTITTSTYYLLDLSTITGYLTAMKP